ncbi:AfsR/SARP family transcriptional regulator, partial [Streptomyces sp. T-3]|nr:AfsR/SARP family transcriptional regulator [Streptomyces sp. T-3]
LRTLTLDELADRLDDRFRLLSRGDRTKAPRHRTLRAVVEWSWELLDEEERALARRFTVFAGGAAPAAVGDVCEVPYPDDLLASLAEKSFLEVADGRYRMLQTIRAFCAEQLTEAGEADRLRAAHAAYFLRLATLAEPFLRGHEQLRWLARLATEHGNLDAALRHLVATSPEDALRLVAALSWYGRLRGGYGALAPHARALLDAVGPQPPAGLAEEYILCVLNTFAGDGSDPHEQERIERVRPVLESLKWPFRLPFTLVLWSVASGPRHLDDTLLRVPRPEGDPWALALLELGRGFQGWFAGQPAVSEASFTRAVDGFRTAGDRWGMANSLDPLGMFAHWRGDSERALRLLDEGLGYVRELEAPEETADLLHRKATVLLHAGRADEAAAHFTRVCRYARTA